MEDTLFIHTDKQILRISTNDNTCCRYGSGEIYKSKKDIFNFKPNSSTPVFTEEDLGEDKQINIYGNYLRLVYHVIQYYSQNGVDQTRVFAISDEPMQFVPYFYTRDTETAGNEIPGKEIPDAESYLVIYDHGTLNCFPQYSLEVIDK